MLRDMPREGQGDKRGGVGINCGLCVAVCGAGGLGELIQCYKG
jgi:ferredoxin